MNFLRRFVALVLASAMLCAQILPAAALAAPAQSRPRVGHLGRARRRDRTTRLGFMSGFTCHRQSPLSSMPNSLTASSISVASSQRSSKLVRRAAPRVRHATPPRDAPQPHRVPSVDEMAESLKYTGRLSDMLVPLRHLGATTLQSSAPLREQQASAPAASAPKVGMHLQCGAASESRTSTEEAGATWASRGSTSPRMTPRSPSPSLAPTSFAAASTSFAAASARVRTEAEQALRSSLRVASAAPSPDARDGARVGASATACCEGEL
jgi:hypothetical protein